MASISSIPSERLLAKPRSRSPRTTSSTLAAVRHLSTPTPTVFLHEAITTVASRRNEHDNTNLLRGGHRREVVKPGDTGNAARAAEGFADGMHVRDASGLDGWQSCRLEERSRQSIGRHARGEHHHAGIIPYKRVGR